MFGVDPEPVRDFFPHDFLVAPHDRCERREKAIAVLELGGVLFFNESGVVF